MRMDPNIGPGITVETFTQELRKWVLAKGLLTVDLREVSDPPNDPRDDYIVICEAEFVPKSLRHAQVKFILTDDGYVGFGLETRLRIANRMKVRSRTCCWGAPEAFAAGREPSFRGLKEVLLVLDIVSQGKLAIQATVIPWWGLGPTRATPISDQDSTAIEFCRKLRWPTSLNNRPFTKIVMFDAWR
jgi:hypothetical protein